jgi:hypothetical protein
MQLRWLLLILLLCPTSSLAFEGLGVRLFSEVVNSDLSIKDEEGDREVTMNPKPPNFNGAALSYKGIGGSYQETQRNDEENQSEMRGFKWTIPWDNFLFEVYGLRIEGAEVSNNPQNFREDVEAEVHGGHITWSHDDDINFSSIFGLDKDITKGSQPGSSGTFYALSYQEAIWKADSTFWPTPSGPDDEFAFRYIRRRIVQLNWGGAYVKYFEYMRFSVMGSLGYFGGYRNLHYENREDIHEGENGFGITVATSIASDLGLRSLSKSWGTSFIYGVSLLFHNAESLNTPKVGTSQSNITIYLGTLW